MRNDLSGKPPLPEKAAPNVRQYKKTGGQSGSGKLLVPTGGYLEGYTHTLNPYIGCAFGCEYCYVRRLPVGLFRKEPWGSWVDAKPVDRERFRRELQREKAKGPVILFFSSATDPYQPVEYRERRTRQLLSVLVEEPPDFILLQTRGPLVLRDIDLLRLLGARLRVSLTVETDREDIRRAFSPAAPPLAARLRALRTLREAGIPCQAAVSPVLPSSEAFAQTLARAVDRVCIDDYFMGDGSLGRRTERLGIRTIYERLGLMEWYAPDAWRALHEQLLRHFPEERVKVSREGFQP